MDTEEWKATYILGITYQPVQLYVSILRQYLFSGQCILVWLLEYFSAIMLVSDLGTLSIGNFHKHRFDMHVSCYHVDGHMDMSLIAMLAAMAIHDGEQSGQMQCNVLKRQLQSPPPPLCAMFSCTSP